MGLRQADEFGVEDLFFARMVQSYFLEHVDQEEKVYVELLID